MDNREYRYTDENTFSNTGYYVFFIEAKYLNSKGKAIFESFGVSKQDVSPILDAHEICFVLEALEMAEIIDTKSGPSLGDLSFKGMVYALEGLRPFIDDTCILLVSPDEDEIFVMGVQDGHKLRILKKYNKKFLKIIKALKKRDIVLEDLIPEDPMDNR